MPLALKFNRKEDAEDLLQDVVLKMLEKKVHEKLDYTGQRLYARQTLINTALKNYKKFKRRNEIFTNFYPFKEIEKPRVEGAIELKQVLQKLKKIDPRFSKSLIAFVYGYSTNEIGKAAGINQNAVLSRISYARRDLKKLL